MKMPASGACVAMRLIVEFRRYLDEPSVTNTAFRDDAGCKIADIGAAAAQHIQFQAGAVIEMHMQG